MSISDFILDEEYLVFCGSLGVESTYYDGTFIYIDLRKHSEFIDEFDVDIVLE